MALCNGTKVTTCHWMCKNMNSSMSVSFYAYNGEASFSSNNTCLLNINTTSLCPQSINCDVLCDNFEDNHCLYTSITFWGFILLMCFGNIGFNVSNCISDAICFDVLGKSCYMYVYQ